MNILENYIPATIRAEAVAKIDLVAKALGVPYLALLAVMWKESKLNPKAYNSNGGASGLIQFMPSTAKGLGTTTDQLRNMSFVQQMDYVFAYFKPFKGKIKTYQDLYLYTFFPLAIGKPDNWVIQSKNLSPETIAKANKVIDLNKNGQITVGEFKQYSLNGFPVGVAEELKKKG